MIVEKLDSLPSLLAVQKEWRTLEVHSGLPFDTWDWAFTWWAELRENKLAIKDSLFVRAMRTDQGELVAIAPMFVSRRPSMGPICVRQLQFFGADPNITELRGIVALPGRRSEAYRALLSHALENAQQWDSMLLSGIPPDLDLSELTRPSDFEWRGQTLDYELPLPGCWDTLRAGLPRNIKESLRKCYNSLKREGRTFRLEIAERPEQVGPALETFFRFHTARAHLVDTVEHKDVFKPPEARRFLHDVCRRFAERGCLRIFQLVVDEQVVAVRIGFVVGDALYLYYSGYNQEFAKYSVMTTAVAEAIKYAIAQGLKTVNLSTGKDNSKLRWNPVEVVTRQALLISPSKRAELVHHAYRHAVIAIDSMPVLRRAMNFLARRDDPGFARAR